jgi:hypothetical protein
MRLHRQYVERIIAASRDLEFGLSYPYVLPYVIRGAGPRYCADSSLYPTRLQHLCAVGDVHREGRSAPHEGQSNESESTAKEPAAESTWAAE